MTPALRDAILAALSPDDVGRLVAAVKARALAGDLEAAALLLRLALEAGQPPEEPRPEQPAKRPPGRPRANPPPVVPDDDDDEDDEEPEVPAPVPRPELPPAAEARLNRSRQLADYLRKGPRSIDELTRGGVWRERQVREIAAESPEYFAIPRFDQRAVALTERGIKDLLGG